MSHEDPFPPRATNTQTQARDNGAVGACPKGWKTQLGRQAQGDSRGLDCRAN